MWHLRYVLVPLFTESLAVRAGARAEPAMRRLVPSRYSRREQKESGETRGNDSLPRLQGGMLLQQFHRDFERDKLEETHKSVS